MLFPKSNVVGFALLAAVVIASSSCGKKKSSSSDKDIAKTFAVSGQLAIQSNLELAASAPNLIYALPAKVIENIYSFDKSVLATYPVGADGKFTAAVNSGYGDTLLVAVDTNAANRLEGIRGVLSLKDDSGSLLRIPAGEGSGSVDMGTLSPDASGKEFTSNKKTDDVTSSFNLDLSKMKELARTDDSARGLINVVANIKDNGDYFFAKPYMVFKSNIQNIKNIASAADNVSYNGYGIYFVAKWTGLTTESLCGGSNAANKLTLVPPAGVKPKLCQENSSNCSTNKEFDELTNLNTGALTSEGSNRSACSSQKASGQSFADDGEFYAYKESSLGGTSRPVGFNWGGNGYNGQLAAGTWVLKLNGSEVGRYDLAAANPLNANNKATVYVPSVKAVLDGASKVTNIEVEWFLWNSGTGSYEKVSNLETFQRVVTDIGAEIADYGGGCSTKSIFNQLSTSGSTMSLNVSSFGATFPAVSYSSNPSSCDAESIAVAYTMNGISYRFDFRPFY